MSSHKMDVNDLLKDELEFELECRGIVNIATVNPMRKILREILSREKEEGSAINIVVPASCTKDTLAQIIIGEKKFQVLNTAFEEKPDNNIKKRLISRLIHLRNRVKLIIPSSVYLERHSKLCSDIQRCFEALLSTEDKEDEEDGDEELSDKYKEILQLTLGQEGLDIIAKLEPSSTDGEEQGQPEPPIKDLVKRDNLLYNSRRNNMRTSTFDQDFIKRKLVPIKDWGLKFTGRGDISVNAFLERLDELKIARNADNDDLWRYAIDLFEGDALIWFRANRDHVNNWEELVKHLTLSFQRPYYQEELLEEIKKRTQAKEESVMIYIAVMQNMFNRLPDQISEQQKIAILLKNIQPYFQQAVCRDTFNSVTEITMVLRILERSKTNCENFQEPKNAMNVLEPDLAYQARAHPEVEAIYSDPSKPVTNEEHGKSGMKCWNCRSVGHTFRDCRLPQQRLFCYKCGKFGQTTNKCNCKKQGNGN